NDLSFDMVVVIPSYELKTKDARSVLPKDLSYQEAVKASSISNVMVAALLTKNLELMGKMMELDLFHQQYRANLIPELNNIHRVTKKTGALGDAISCAKPTIIYFTEGERYNQLKGKLSLVFEGNQVEELEIKKRCRQRTTVSLYEK